MPSLLVELFSEEIPARLQTRAGADLQRLMTSKLNEAGLSYDRVENFSGPRRLTLHVQGLPHASPDTREERKGPRVGAPDKAIEGFLRGAGLSDIAEAQVQETKKGDVYVAVIEKKGRPATEVITEALADTVKNFPWPKSQRWGDGDLRWVRPLRGVLLTLDGAAVPFSLENGSQPIEAGATTITHRVLGQGEVQTPTFDTYEQALEEGRVVLRTDERKARILDGANALCEEAGLELVQDEGLLNEVAGLAEWPIPHLGSFDEKFLALPDEVITAAMRGHQKYFSVRDPKTGRLAPCFIAVADIEAGETMLGGYERVLTARLSDALFLYHNDLKKPLEQHAQKLSGTTFFEGLGTLEDKSILLTGGAQYLGKQLGLDINVVGKAAGLAKADLASEMVYEFPELQGLMGRYYALAEGLEDDVADAIRDHYKPLGPSDDLPANDIGIAVSFADKLDTLAAFWSIDKKPTGSGDPFALRRAALSIIRLVLERDIRVPMVKSLEGAFLARTPAIIDGETPFALEKMARFADGPQNRDRIKKILVDPLVVDLLSFFHDRLSVYFRDQGYRHDHIAAALEEGADDFVLIEKKLKALAALLGTEEGANLTAAYKRASNIQKAEEKKTGLPETDVNASLFEQDEEKALHAALDQAETEATKALETEDFDAAMRSLAQVRAPLDAFFEGVTVNSDNQNLRINRLAQLLRFKSVVNRVADFDRLEG